MSLETESCQLSDAEVLGVLYVAGIAVNSESPLAGLVEGYVASPPSDSVQSGLGRQGILTAPNAVERRWAEAIRVLAQPLWSLAIVLGSSDGYTFYEYFSGGSLTAPRLVCHRSVDEGSRQISFFYSLDALLAQLSQTVDVDGPITRAMPIGEFSPREFMVASTLLDVYRHQYFRSLLDRQPNTPLDFTRDDLMQLFNDGLGSDDTRWFVTLCNASLPFEFNLQPEDLPDLITSMADRGWIEIVSDSGFHYRLTDTLVDLGRLLLLPQAFAAFKVEQMLDGQGQQPRSLSAVRTPQSMWVLEYQASMHGPVSVALNCINGNELQSLLVSMIEEAETRTPALQARLASMPPRPAPAPPAPSQPTILPIPAPGGGFLPPSPLPPVSMGPPSGNGPSLLRSRQDMIGSSAGVAFDDPATTAWGSGPPYSVNDRPTEMPRAPSTRTAPDASEVVCVHCGQMINRSKKFCRGCGGATVDSLRAAATTESLLSSPPPLVPVPSGAWPPAAPAPPPPPSPPWANPSSPPAQPSWAGPSAPAPSRGPVGPDMPWGPPPAPPIGPPGFAAPPAFPPSFPPIGGGGPLPPSAPFPGYPGPPAPVPGPPSLVGGGQSPAGPPAGGPNMVPCPICMNPVSERAKFCGHCGSNIAISRQDSPAPAAVERNCPGCGFRSMKATTFCPNCGNRMV